MAASAPSPAGLAPRPGPAPAIPAMASLCPATGRGPQNQSTALSNHARSKGPFLQAREIDLSPASRSKTGRRADSHGTGWSTNPLLARLQQLGVVHPHHKERLLGCALLQVE